MSDWINVADVTPRIAYTATASQTAFVVPFVFFASADLFVYQNTTLLTLATHYTVSGAEDEDGGTITLLTGATVGDEIMIVREVAIVQTTHIPPSGPLDIAAVNIQFSKLIAIDQQAADKQERSIHFPDSDSSLSGELASVATRKNLLLGFGTDGELIYPLGPTYVGDTATGVAIVDSRATAAVTTFDVSVNVVVTEGLAVPGDGGGAVYIRGLVGDPGAFQDAGGVYWKFGAIAGSVQQVDTRVTAAATTFAVNVNVVLTNGYTTSGDGGAARYIRGTVSSYGAFQDAGGVYWGLDLSGPFVFAKWFGVKADGVTDDYTALQAFLNAISGNGAAGSGSIIGVFPSGTCYVSAGRPTLTVNSSALAQQYHLIGYGCTIRTDPAQAISGLYIKRGTYLTHGDEQRGVTVEGLTVQQNNNANATYGIEVDDPNVALVRCTIYGGDDGVTHHQPAYAGIYYRQSDLQDEATGAFWGRIEGCYIKGVGNTTSSIPFCILIRGDCNRMMIKNNIIGQATYGVFLVNSATSPSNAANAAIANGVTISGNDFGSCQIGVGIGTTLPLVSAVAGLRIFDNTFETMVQSVLDLTPITVSHVFPNLLGPNLYYSVGALISNPNSIAFVVNEQFMGSATLSTGTVTANSTATLGTVSVPGATTDLCVEVTAAGSLLGCVATGYISSTGVATIRLSNPTGGSLSCGSLKFRVVAKATN